MNTNTILSMVKDNGINEKYRIMNAIITDASIYIDINNTLILSIEFDMENRKHYKFCGVCVANEDVTSCDNFAGVYLYKVLQIAGVDNWENVIGKAIKVKQNQDDYIVSIGHIIKNIWFYPIKESTPKNKGGNTNG